MAGNFNRIFSSGLRQISHIKYSWKSKRFRQTGPELSGVICSTNQIAFVRSSNLKIKFELKIIHQWWVRISSPLHLKVSNAQLTHFLLPKFILCYKMWPTSYFQTTFFPFHFICVQAKASYRSVSTSLLNVERGKIYRRFSRKIYVHWTRWRKANSYLLFQ